MSTHDKKRQTVLVAVKETGALGFRSAVNSNVKSRGSSKLITHVTTCHWPLEKSFEVEIAINKYICDAIYAEKGKSLRMTAIRGKYLCKQKKNCLFVPKFSEILIKERQ